MGKLEKIANGLMILGVITSLGGTTAGLVSSVYEPDHVQRPNSRYFEGEELSPTQYNSLIGGGVGGPTLFLLGGTTSLITYRLKENKRSKY